MTLTDAFALIGVGAIAGGIAGFVLARLFRPRGRHRRDDP